MRGANIPKYDIGLIERYGKPYWERIKFDLVRLYPLLKLHQNDYPELIAKSREIAKELKSADQVYTPTERLELRLKYNEKLGIYKT